MTDYITLEILARRVADDLVDMHNSTGIELESWSNAKRLVELFYYVDSKVVIGGKREN